MRYAAALFDMDGTLIHNGECERDAWIEAYREVGADLTDMDFFVSRILGHKDVDVLGTIGLPVDLAAGIRQRRREIYTKLIGKQAEWIYGAEQVLHELRDEKTGIVTLSRRMYTDAIHEKLGLYDRVSTTITYDEVQDGRGKPEPDGLLLAATLLDADPDRCIYIGDHSVDIMAAEKAGMESCLVSEKNINGCKPTYTVPSIGKVLHIVRR